MLGAHSGEQTRSPTCWSRLDEGPAYYPDGEVTDEPAETLVAELIREAALEGVRDELPHSIAVEIDEMGLREGRPEDKPLLDVFASRLSSATREADHDRQGRRAHQAGRHEAGRQITALLHGARWT